MEKINTIGKTITGLSDAESNMIIRALKARANHFKDKAFSATVEVDRQNEISISKAYNELAELVEKQNH